ncbi:RtcB family protein [Phragmitibacter flavus]|uniref:tRNA-splicing ligase RtcB n=1 Tax=Phragmitibacter flavus TaxID=2576071 RepID=A0A5R8KA49_9BACT|nr:RtcB family protein [Phragmitibacter flavus]TLD69147.1 RtcB family protein [Phragmitibacter flavus]
MNTLQLQLHPTAEAEAFLPAVDNKGKPITVIGNDAIRQTFDQQTLQQALNSRSAPGVTDVVLNPDAHVGYGAPIGCVMASPTHIYPGPVGVDIKCSMSLLQLDIPNDDLIDKRVRRALIEAIVERTPTGAGRGQREAKKSRAVSADLGVQVCTQGATADVCNALGIPPEWAQRCEDAFHFGHDGNVSTLVDRLENIRRFNGMPNFESKMRQLGSYGGGNHFGECEAVQLHDDPTMRQAADTFGLKDGHIAFLSHCGSRGFGNILAQRQFKILEEHFSKWSTPFPANDKHLVYAPLGTPQANDYLDDMAMGANFATVNHLLINALVLEAFQEVLPGVKGQLVYFISHNIARQEVVNNQLSWVHRKGATRAFPAGHHALANTIYANTGHPILLPGNPRDGSVVMVAQPGAEKTCYSVNHGAGRALGRKAAIRALDQKTVDDDFTTYDILTNCRQYPKDEAPAAYKDFKEVLNSVESAGLAKTVATLKARFVIKDSSEADD